MSNETSHVSLVCKKAVLYTPIGSAIKSGVTTCIMHPGGRLSEECSWQIRNLVDDTWYDVFYGLCAHCSRKLDEKPQYQLMIDYEIKIRLQNEGMKNASNKQ